MLRLGAALLLMSILAACGGVQPLTVADANYAEEVDEQGLIREAAALDADLENQGVVDDGSPLVRYVAAVGSRVVPAGAQGPPLRFRVIHDASINAFALPNGSVYVTLGLLVRLHNEAQLAQVLGHEVSHVLQRHGLEQYRANKAGSVASVTTEIVTLGVSKAFVSLPIALGLTRYARGREEEADKDGIVAAKAAGYDASEAAGVYDALASSLPDWLADENSIYATHPSLRERARYSREMINTSPELQGGGQVGDDELRRATFAAREQYVALLLVDRQYAAARDFVAGPTAPQPAEADRPGRASRACAEGEALLGMARDPFGAALEAAARAHQKIDDARLSVARGRVQETAREALAAFERCAELDPSRPDAQRGIGLARLILEETAPAVEALTSYLGLAGEGAPDRRYVRALIGAIQP